MPRRTYLIVFALAWLGGALHPSVTYAQRQVCSVEQGQAFIDAGRFKDAIREFSCVIDAFPTEVEGYRGRIEAELLVGRFSDAVRDYARVTAYVEPVHPDVATIILDGYADRLAAAPDSITALTGASFARWWFFQYAQAIQLLNQLLAIRPDDLYGNLFRGSSRLLRGMSSDAGDVDLEQAIALAPKSPDVHYIVADAYLYGRADYARAFDEAMFALKGGLDTPRVHAILASAYLAFGDMRAAAGEIAAHIALVTTELSASQSILNGDTFTLPVVPGRTWDIPLDATAGATLTVQTSSHDFYDTILVLLAPDGTPVIGSDDYRQYFAGFKWVAGQTGTYHLRVTSFEAVNTGDLIVTRN